ncbi:MAG TPA: carboxypeptidase-like regulatory domain-containing protein [Tepidisphaeraceae bacterium]|nr:carboxypeptidase-like regulatory domain-containing protein [Tepidisphaeraceae bacterium]
MLRIFQIGLITLLLSSPSWALYGISFSVQPVQDGAWPAGSAALANLAGRFAIADGDSGNSIFAYHGATADFQQAIDLLGKIADPHVRLIVHGGADPTNMFSVPNRKPIQPVDWTFEVFNADRFNKRQKMLGDFGLRPVPLPPPTINLFLYKDSPINFAAIKVPDDVRITDERASASGATASLVHGNVLDASTNQPLVDAEVSLTKYSPEDRKWHPLHAIKTAADGGFEFKNLEPQSYRLLARADGYASRDAAQVQILDDTAKQVSVALVKQVLLTGTVKDIDGKGVKGINVRAVGMVTADGADYRTSEEDSQTTTDAEGNFSLGKLPAGTLLIYVTGDGYFDLDTSKTFTAPQQGLVIHVTPTGSIKGTVVDNTGNPAVAGNIRVSPPGDPVGKWGGSAQIKPDGSFEFKNVPPGEYIVSANPDPSRAPNASDVKIELKAGQTADVSLMQTRTPVQPRVIRGR